MSASHRVRRQQVRPVQFGDVQVTHPSGFSRPGAGASSVGPVQPSSPSGVASSSMPTTPTARSTVGPTAGWYRNSQRSPRSVPRTAGHAVTALSRSTGDGRGTRRPPELRLRVRHDHGLRQPSACAVVLHRQAGVRRGQAVPRLAGFVIPARGGRLRIRVPGSGTSRVGTFTRVAMARSSSALSVGHRGVRHAAVHADHRFVVHVGQGAADRSGQQAARARTTSRPSRSTHSRPSSACCASSRSCHGWPAWWAPGWCA